ncbi:glutamine--fructose-6-phosphate transaminase (isomerizing) [Pandoraea sp.]|uniref:glutamine--fructose-6-phosphate transaminase (isomerizing) n=1 Tax=Pandoraea sp. TaxID=1883445 RepID=UPI00120CE303|nr:glutamine--fructose-6-phosphate transaminase (isomerizing) [Pandoraea sp.]TAL53515.1 MAG: glutamine--fructose-6-phosphate transaminase (isomerizing) [Pandoraea sp.]TAM14943.1 MAG: glutamine--fructose-6-phosphate transaminase (isomerizing) [Pandoraea sp.]
MCGIVGAVTGRNIVPVLMQGLQRLEYRGYDSCGIAVHDQGLFRARSIARVSELQAQIDASGFAGNSGIAHTRWATHGGPVIDNAHPHFSLDRQGDRRIALVHNGIIENYELIRTELKSLGYLFESQTDTEVIAHLINHLYDGDLLHAVEKAVKRLTGAFAIAVICKSEPHRMVGARLGCPLVAGLGHGENFLASDAMALSGATDQIIYLEEGDLVDVRQTSIRVVDRNGISVNRKIHTVSATAGPAELAPFRHYMQKEIFEQPGVLADTLIGSENLDAGMFGAGASEIFKQINAIRILACGSSYYAGMTAKYWIESLVGIPVSVEVASEYRYREPAVNPHALVLAISQSGETADTLAALKYAHQLGHRHSLAICNVGVSALVREAELSFLTRAGIEIGVASTKAFTTQLAALLILGLTLAKLRGHLTPEQQRLHVNALRHLPAAICRILELEPQIMAWASLFARKENALFLGRGLHYPIALEGALKLKETSYIHAEAYPAGELKHGPLALVTEDMPVVTIAPNDSLLGKLKSNMQEVRARGGQLYVFADADSMVAPSDGMHVIQLPEHHGLLSPILHVVPLQLLAYHTALARGTDIDKPRNLAKSVTVE